MSAIAKLHSRLRFAREGQSDMDARTRRYLRTLAKNFTQKHPPFTPGNTSDVPEDAHEVLGEQFHRQRGRCAHCQKTLSLAHNSGTSLDHRVPRSKGGSNHLSNAQFL